MEEPKTTAFRIQRKVLESGVEQEDCHTSILCSTVDLNTVT